ncbi:hypothetical protein AX14_012074 [Amanita brunnescens Koide BX004]|nr:hypothetical protein AX14_012074 [Amanita brunnescens Koide BX004]
MKGALRARVGFGFDDAAVGFLAASCVACGSRRTAGTSPRAATGPRRYTTSRRVGRCGERPSPPHFDIYSRVRSAEMSCCGGGAGSVLFHEAEKKDMYIRSLCFSPGGKFLATGAEDGRIRIWDIGEKRVLHVYEGHREDVYSLDLSLDGRLIVSGSGDKTVRIWNMSNSNAPPMILQTNKSITSVAISPNGRFVAAGCLGTVVRIWETETGRLLETLGDHRDTVYSVSFTPDGRSLLSGSLDKTLKMWDVSRLGQELEGYTSRCRLSLTGHKDYVLSVASTFDGKWAVSSSKDCGVMFWNSRTGIAQCMIQGHKSSVLSIGLSPLGGCLATGGGDWQARIWSYGFLPPIQQPIETIKAAELDFHTAPPECKREGPGWYAVFNASVKRVLDVQLVHNFMHESVVCCVKFSPKGKYLATGCNGGANIYDVKTGIKKCSLNHGTAENPKDSYIRSVCFSPDGQLLVTGAEDGRIRVWEIAKQCIIHTHEGHQKEIYSLDISFNGRLVVSGSGDGTAKIWDMTSHRLLKVLTVTDPDLSNNDPGIASVAFSPNGHFIATGCLDSTVRVWEVATGHMVEKLRGHKDSVYSVAFTPDGKELVSGSLDKTLKLWDVSWLSVAGQTQCKMSLTGHKDFVLSVLVSPDGQWLVSASKDLGVIFWDRGGIAQCMLRGHLNSVISIALSPTAGLLATGSGDWQAKIWRYEPRIDGDY